VSSALGVTQHLALTGITSDHKTPNTFNYTGNAILSTPTYHGTIVYAAGGVGGLTMFQNTGLGIASNATFVTGDVGGGVKWYANNRLGFRADYRFVMVQSSDVAPAFFGQGARQGHRVYGALVLNLLR
ncbi:MAG TPA: hypothetical protein VLV86_26090, partial [Vicinamibacterales bacterium]|nr:hypothetical protein [Vicinamibacterales bacterium]